MVIDWGQLLPWLLGIIGIVIGGWKTQVAAKAEADKKTAEAEAAKITAEAEQQSVMTRLTERQQTLLEEMQKNNQRRDKASASQLRRISNLFNDIRNGESNIHNAIGQLMISVNSIPQAVAQAVVTGIAEANKTEVKELGKLLRSEMALDRFEREGYRFPAAEDPDWREEMIYPLEPEVTIHKGPYNDDDVRLRKPCATIDPQGEKVRLIANRYPEFIIVDKMTDGERCWGYVPRKKVRIGPADP